MNAADWIGFIGVTILLLAFVLNLTGKIAQDHLLYIIMNIAGAGLAGLASVMIHYIPFIILEAAWTLVSLFGLVNYFRKRS